MDIHKNAHLTPHSRAELMRAGFITQVQDDAVKTVSQQAEALAEQ